MPGRVYRREAIVTSLAPRGRKNAHRGCAERNERPASEQRRLAAEGAKRGQEPNWQDGSCLLVFDQFWLSKNKTKAGSEKGSGANGTAAFGAVTYVKLLA